MSRCSDIRRWALPAALSLAFHAVLFLLPVGPDVLEPRPVMRLTLARPVRVPGSLRPAGGGAQGNEARPLLPSPPPAPLQKDEPRSEIDPRKKADSAKETKQSPKPQRKPVSKAKPKPTPKLKPKPEPKPVADPAVREVPGEASAVVRGRAPLPNAGGSGLGGGRGGAVGSGEGTSSGPGSETGPVDVGTLRILSKTPPEYPLFSRKRREEGQLTILITIQSGCVTDAQVERGSGYPRLDEAALRAVRTWRFDHPGRIRARVPVSFHLER